MTARRHALPLWLFVLLFVIPAFASLKTRAVLTSALFLSLVIEGMTVHASVDPTEMVTF